MKKTQMTSLEDLPTDGVEVRETKQIFRNIRDRKAELHLTTSALAKRLVQLGYYEYYGPTTLNNLLAGKRKSITIHELLAFSEALEVTPMELCPSLRSKSESAFAREKYRRELISDLMKMP
jgi:transcriptional regulator with XRE-family HTH domain